MGKKMTLGFLVDILNSELSRMVGGAVGSSIDVLRDVRQEITKGEFWQEIENAGMSDLIVFLDDVEDIRYIFLRVSETQTEKIVRINSAIDYYDSSSPEDGGLLSDIKCELVGIGRKMRDSSLVSLVAGARMAALEAREKVAENSIAEHEAAIAKAKEELDGIRSEISELKKILEKEGGQA